MELVFNIKEGSSLINCKEFIGLARLIDPWAEELILPSFMAIHYDYQKYHLNEEVKREGNRNEERDKKSAETIDEKQIYENLLKSVDDQ